MSDLKYKSVEELRRIISAAVEYQQDRQANIDRRALQIATLQAEISMEKRRKRNSHQREVWARRYLAEKPSTEFVRGPEHLYNPLGL